MYYAAARISCNTLWHFQAVKVFLLRIDMWAIMNASARRMCVFVFIWNEAMARGHMVWAPIYRHQLRRHGNYLMRSYGGYLYKVE